MMPPKDLAALLRRVAELLEELPASDVQALLDGHAKLAVSVAASPSSEKSEPEGKDAEVLAVTQALADVKTREAATTVLERAGVSKAVLEKVARSFDLPVRRSDSVDRLRRRIVEGVVGFKINSAAIRGRSTP